MVIRVDVHVLEGGPDVGDGAGPGEAGPGPRGGGTGVPARGAQGVSCRVRRRPVVRLHRTYPAQRNNRVEISKRKDRFTPNFRNV